MRLLFDQIHSKLRNAAERIRLLHSDSGVEIVEVW